MELKKENLKYIEKAFRRMKSKQDLLELLNYCKLLIYGKHCFPISLSQLTYHASQNLNPKKYHKFSIKKSDGSERVINAPNAGLKCIQRCLNLIFQIIYEPSPSANGFVNGRSIVTNATSHAGHRYVYNIDIKDFFNSFDQARLWGRLKNKPFNLNKSTGKLELANIIASLCCHEIEVERLDSNKVWQKIKKNVLPQGAPTSPSLTNILCQQLDFYLGAAAKRFGVNYSRYADDITFSSNINVFKSDSDFLNEVTRIVNSQGLIIKDSKTRLQTSEFRQTVTGITVNTKPNLTKKYIKGIRMWLYFWEVYGIDKANKIFSNELLRNGGNEELNRAPLEKVLIGKINFVKMVRGADDIQYLKLLKTYNSLKSESANIGSKAPKSSSGIKTPLKASPPEIIPILHAPKALVDILRMFTKDNSILKYATHTWDAGKDESKFCSYEDFLRKAKLEFEKVNYRLNGLRPQLRAKILSFLFNKDVKQSGWGTMRIKFGWSSPELAEEMKKKPSSKPENLLIPLYAQTFIKTFDGTNTILRFKEVIDIFKNEIEFRDDTSTLANMLLEYHDSYLNGFKIVDFENLENKSFYTDVDYIRKVFTIIFESFSNRRKRNEENKVGYTLEEDLSGYCLKITHHESFCRGISKDDEKFSLTRGDFATIKTNLLNLCDWSIESEFSEGMHRINFLTSENEVPRDIPITDCKGFSHIFKFYK